MDDLPLDAKVRALFDAGAGESLESGLFLPVATLESGARIGLDASAAWVLVPAEGGAPRIYAADNGHTFVEALESKRDEFDALVEAGARAIGLPPDEVCLSFPATGVVRAVLAKRFAFTTRLALHWLRLTELREMRAEIIEVSRDPSMPIPIKDLAERLIVAE